VRVQCGKETESLAAEEADECASIECLCGSYQGANSERCAGSGFQTGDGYGRNKFQRMDSRCNLMA
jgi:hypothetical protein